MVGRPHVVLASAITLDGRLASRMGYSKLSCPYDLKRLHAIRRSVDAIVVGANTIVVDDPELTVRHVRAESQPAKVIVDGRLKIPLSARALRGGRVYVATTMEAPRDKVEALKSMGVEVLIFEGPRIRMVELLGKLGGLGIRRILVEGGGRLNWCFVEEDLIDELYLTITGYVFGSGIGLFEVVGFEGLEGPKYVVREVAVCKCGREVVLHMAKEGVQLLNLLRDFVEFGIREVLAVEGG